MGKGKKGKRRKVKKDSLIRDETLKISRKNGNGSLIRRVWQDDKGNVTKYSLAYINFKLYTGDNGRVLGYDNAHGYHHKHFMGNEENINFTSFEKIEETFEKEYKVLHEKAKK